MILSEQKSAKTIELLEALRRDNPLIGNRHDPEGAAMSVPTDPRAVLKVIQDAHEEMLAEPERHNGLAAPFPNASPC